MPGEGAIYGNGILAENGYYGEVVGLDDLYVLIQEECKATDANEQSFLHMLQQGQQAKTLGPPPSINAGDLAEARWGIIWPPDPLDAREQAHKNALQKLIEHRKMQMKGKKPHEFSYKKNWTAQAFLWDEGRHVLLTNMKPNVVPYYLCVVGSPDRIPWEFQQELDSVYAVGRLWFDDPADCLRYVDHVLAHEQAPESGTLEREVLFLGTHHQDDVPTQHSAELLIKPLYNWLSGKKEYNWKPSLLLGNEAGSEATKTHLLYRLRGYGLDGSTPQASPALLFTAGHGVEYKEPKTDQYARQGALLCQEWPGRRNAPQPQQYLAGDDVSAELKVAGMVAFCFACFSAGTPEKQDWVRPTLLNRPRRIALQPFVARLPQKLLAQGLLAFIGHVSKTWEYSFLGTAGVSDQVGPFRETIYELLHGRQVGHAVDYLNQQWPGWTLELNALVTDKHSSKEEVIATWIARNDLRGFVVLGDPATKVSNELTK
jgi:hypothetical protein